MERLGRLESIELRAAWVSEAGEFTPWLAQVENIGLLGDAIGLELEVEATEKDVGPFRADILCKDLGTDTWVLIENQLERTDHTHLGQILTYASGLNAVTVVWIARRITDEHRAVLDWLNRITSEEFNFFGLEIELWRIGDSPLAPKFNVVCKPNEWSKSVTKGRQQIADVTGARLIQLEFWTAFREFVLSRKTVIKPTKPLPQQWMTISIGRTGFQLSAIVSTWDSVRESYESNELRAELNIAADPERVYLRCLEREKEVIEREVGEALIWYSAENTRSCRIYLRRSAKIEDRSQWPEYHEWLLTKLERLRGAFAERIKALPRDCAEAERHVYGESETC